MTQLQHEYPGVIAPGKEKSYGGSQMASPDKVMRRCGCGVVAAADLLLYLHRFRQPLPLLAGTAADLTGEEYEELLQRLRRRYLPLFYPVGMNGLTLALGLNRIFRHNGLQLRARWDMSEKKLWRHIEDMLRRDIPVILSIGPSFPRLWKKGKESLYRREQGDLRRVTETRAHYVTVTGMNDEWLRISSWGKEYYLSRTEYEAYRREFSSALVSNIVYIS